MIEYIISDCTETRDDDSNNHYNDNNIRTLSLPCNLISVSQNFCSSVKYLSSMNTLEWPTLAITPESGTVVYIGRYACFSKELPSSFVAKSSRFLPQVTRPNYVLTLFCSLTRSRRLHRKNTRAQYIDNYAKKKKFEQIRRTDTIAQRGGRTRTAAAARELGAAADRRPREDSSTIEHRRRR